MDTSKTVVAVTKEAARTPVIKVSAKTGRPTQIRTQDGQVQFKCQYCGKWLNAEESIEAEAGGYCDHLREEGLDDAALAELKASKTVEKLPTNAKGETWVKVAAVDRACKKANIPISRLVAAFGGDRGIDPALRPEFQFVYFGRARYVDPWCLTKEGLSFLRSIGNTGPAMKDEKKTKSVKPQNKTEEVLAPEA